MEQATVMFEFDGMVENGEISLVAGEIVTIYRKDVGDGWWEGKTQNGESGLFPAAYVEVLQNGNHLQSGTATPRYSTVPGEDYDQNPSTPPPSYSQHTSTYDSGVTNSYGAPLNSFGTTAQFDNDDAWSEDWDDSSSATTVQPQNKIPGSATQYGSLARDVSSLNSVENRGTRAPGSVRQNLNRFSSFVKHGGEDYILGKTDARVRQVDQIQIIPGGDGLCWKDNDHKFTCSIENPKQQSKMKGLKKFICYNLTPSDTAVTVQRRYKHFDWLYGRLTERFPIIAIPKLPEKQASGRFEEDFIEARMARLKLWVLYICRHPILSKAQLFRNFVTLTEQKAWKMSKRQAEKDQLCAANFFLTVSTPPPVPDSDKALDHFKKTAKTMDDAISHYSSCTNNMTNKYQGLFKKEYQSFGKAITNVATSFNMHQTEQSKSLTVAMKHTGQAFHRIGEMFANQPREDFHLMTDHLWLYKGIMDTMPDVWHMQTGAVRKVKECRRLRDEGKMTSMECDAITERANHVSCCMSAEISHFHKERIRSFALAQRDLIEKQAQFFENLALELRNTLKYYDEVRIDP